MERRVFHLYARSHRSLSTIWYKYLRNSAYHQHGETNDDNNLTVNMHFQHKSLKALFRPPDKIERSNLVKDMCSHTCTIFSNKVRKLEQRVKALLFLHSHNTWPETGTTISYECKECKSDIVKQWIFQERSIRFGWNLHSIIATRNLRCARY